MAANNAEQASESFLLGSWALGGIALKGSFGGHCTKAARVAATARRDPEGKNANGKNF